MPHCSIYLYRLCCISQLDAATYLLQSRRPTTTQPPLGVHHASTSISTTTHRFSAQPSLPNHLSSAPLYLPTYLPTYLSIYLSVCLSVYLSMCRLYLRLPPRLPSASYTPCRPHAYSDLEGRGEGGRRARRTNLRNSGLNLRRS